MEQIEAAEVDRQAVHDHSAMDGGNGKAGVADNPTEMSHGKLLTHAGDRLGAGSESSQGFPWRQTASR